MSRPLELPGFSDVVEIGAGAHGTVYRAWEADFDRTVAIKVLHGVHTSPESLERFARERRVLGGLSRHPHIVTVYAAGISEAEQPYIVMSFLEGGAWGDRIERARTLPWTDVLDTGVKLCGALATAHAAGVLHRDIKPDNVLIDEFGEPQLADFGVARLQGGQTITAEGSAIGTLCYMAPEAIEGEVTLTTDVYSLAATLHHALLGRPAFARDELMACIVAIASDDIPSLAGMGVPAVVEAAILGGMARDREVRHVDAVIFGRALQAAQAALGRAMTPMMIRGVAPVPDIPAPAVQPAAQAAPEEAVLLARIDAGEGDAAAAALTVSRHRAVRGDVDGAVAVLEQILAIPGLPHGQVRAALARLTARSGRPAAAAEALAVADGHPDLPAARLAMADMDRRAGRTDAAVSVLAQLAGRDGDAEVAGWAALGLAHCRRRSDPEAALAGYVSQLGDAATPELPRAVAELSRAQVLVDLGRVREAAAVLEEIVGTSGHPRRAEATTMLLQESLAAGDVREADARLEQLRALGDDPLAGPWIAYGHALLAAARGDRAAVIEAVEPLAVAWPSAAGSGLLGSAGELLMAVGADGHAEELLRVVCDRRIPGHQAEASVVLGDVHRGRGELARAVECYTAAMATDEPGFSTRAALSRAELAMQAGAHEEAEPVLARCAASPDLAHALQARILQGLSLLDQGRWGRGRAALEEVAGSGHVRMAVSALLWLIRLHSVREDVASAAAAMAMAEDLAAEDPVLLVEVLRAGADAHLHAGRLEQAVEKLHEAAALAGAFVRDEIAVQHAALLADSGQDRAAATRLQRVLAEAGNGVAVGKAELLLAQLELRGGDTADGEARLRRLARQDTPVAAAANATIMLTGLDPVPTSPGGRA